jgi:thiol-disulfide isomerase/thioredoxin
MTSIKTSVLVSMILAAGLQSRAGDDLSGAASDLPVPPIGTVISELKFTDIRGIQRSLSDLGKPRAIVFAFTTSTCPLVRRSFPRLKELAAQFKEQNVLFVAVNAGAGDTIRDMATQAVDFEVPFYFVKDTDLSCVESLGIMRTPQVVILDENRAIRYRGRIDDQIRIGGSKPAASRHDLEIALTEILNKASVSVPRNPGRRLRDHKASGQAGSEGCDMVRTCRAHHLCKMCGVSSSRNGCTFFAADVRRCRSECRNDSHRCGK